MSDYRVNLDVFAGPLDLLLYLIRKDEVDIYDISITRITDQYIHYVDMLKSIDIDLAGDFLVMAATLIHIKSAMLLPKADTEQIDADSSDPRAELIRQLLDYKKFKDAANLLGGAAEEQRERFARPNTIIEQLRPNSEPQIDLEQVSIWDLLEAFDSIMTATGSYMDIRHITDDTPIDLYQIEILHRLQTEGPTVFERIFEGKNSRMVLVGYFLAILELVREKLVWVEQPENSTSLYLRALTEEPAELAVQNATLLSHSRSEENKQTAEQETEQLSDENIEEIEDLPLENDEEPERTEAQIESQEQPAIPIVELPPESDSDTTTMTDEQIQPPAESLDEP